MSVTPTSELQAAAWRARSVPEPEQVRPGLWVIATPVPTPITYTLVYVFEANGRLLVVDCGWPDDAAREGFIGGLAQIGYKPEDIDTLLVTHLHPDHVGLAGWILDVAAEATLRMLPSDLDRLLPGGQARRVERDLSWAQLMGTVGAPEEIGIDRRVNPLAPLTAEQARKAEVLIDRDVVCHGNWRLEVIWVPGHTRGSFVLLEPDHRLLLSGDHVLPTVTPAVTQQNHATDDALGDFLTSLRRVRDLPVDEVLPGHQYRFSGLAARIDELCEHHTIRLDELQQAVTSSPGSSCYDLAHHLQWSGGAFQALGDRDRAMAARETLVHLTHLKLASRVSVRAPSKAADSVVGWYTE